MPTTTVLVVNFNGGEALVRCVDSVRGQQPRPDEIVVVDNASTDGSAGQLPADVRVISCEQNGGFGAAVARGLAETTGAFVWLLNPDTVMEPGCHAAAAGALDADLEAGAVSPRVLQAADPTLIDATAVGLTSAFGQLNVDHGLRDADVPSVSRRVLGPLGGTSLWRRRALERAGGFPTWYFLYWEDIDSALRLDRAGYACITVPSARIRHEGGGSVGRLSSLNVYQMTRNHLPCLIASVPGRLLARHPLRALLAPLRATWLYARRGRGLAALAGLVVGYLLIPRAYLRRRDLPRSGSGTKAAERIAKLMRDADADRLRMQGRAPI